MKKEKLESLLIDYIDNSISEGDKQLVEAELLRNPAAVKLYEELKEVIGLIDQSASYQPTSRLEANFKKMLEEQSVHSEKSKTIFFRPAVYRVAAAIALMVISGFIGFWISEYNAQQNDFAAIKNEMEATRKHLADTRQIVVGMLENRQSASQRIKGVNVAMEMTQADDEIVKVLLHTMLSDPNTNVRLAALDALSKFQDDPEVRKDLIDALSKQTDPMVQISLIQLMVQMKQKQVLDELQRMVDDAGTMKAVRDEAYSGILKLS